MRTDDVKARVRTIEEMVFHVLGDFSLAAVFKPDTPHDPECGGCIINREVKILADELLELRQVDLIKQELVEEKIKRNALELDREQAFAKAGLPVEGSLCDLIAEYQRRDAKRERLLNEIKKDVTNLVTKMG